MSQADKLLANINPGDTHFDHNSPESGLTKLIPAALTEPMRVERLPHSVTSQELLDKYRPKGLLSEQIPLPLYRASAVGSPRRLDNTECIQGYGPLYDDLSHFKEIYGQLVPLLEEWIKDYESRDDLLASMELQDL